MFVQISKFFALCALVVSFAGGAHAQPENDTIFCRTADPVYVAIPTALREDARNHSDEAFFSLTDSLVSEGGCTELPATDVIFNSDDEFCDKEVMSCFLQGGAIAKLPPEAGGGFTEGFAIRGSRYYSGEEEPIVTAVADIPCPVEKLEDGAMFVIMDGHCTVDTNEEDYK